MIDRGPIPVHLVDYGSSWVYHVVGHGSLARLFEAINVVWNAHLISAPLAVPAIMARNYLLGDDEVANGDSMPVSGTFAKGYDGARKLVTQ